MTIYVNTLYRYRKDPVIDGRSQVPKQFDMVQADLPETLYEFSIVFIQRFMIPKKLDFSGNS